MPMYPPSYGGKENAPAANADESIPSSKDSTLEPNAQGLTPGPMPMGMPKPDGMPDPMPMPDQQSPHGAAHIKPRPNHAG